MYRPTAINNEVEMKPKAEAKRYVQDGAQHFSGAWT